MQTLTDHLALTLKRLWNVKIDNNKITGISIKETRSLPDAPFVSYQLYMYKHALFTLIYPACWNDTCAWHTADHWAPNEYTLLHAVINVQLNICNSAVF